MRMKILVEFAGVKSVFCVMSVSARFCRSARVSLSPAACSTVATARAMNRAALAKNLVDIDEHYRRRRKRKRRTESCYEGSVESFGNYIARTEEGGTVAAKAAPELMESHPAGCTASMCFNLIIVRPITNEYASSLSTEDAALHSG